jgi:hypothetical protein
MAVATKTTVVWDLRRVMREKFADVSEERTVSIFRIEHTQLAACFMLDPEDGDSTGVYGVTYHKTVFFKVFNCYQE